MYSISAIIALLILGIIQRLVMPKYMTSFTMGALTAEYYKQDKNHDVIFVGDCEICTAFSPPYLWEKFGINSYVRGSVQQTIWQSYYFLGEMLQEESPKVVVFNVAAMKYDETYNSSYTRMTLDGMRWSPYKIMSVKESLTREESFIEYVFPILLYHDRWNRLTKEDFEWCFKRKDISFNGYLMLTDINPYRKQIRKESARGTEFNVRSYEYLDKIRLLCEKNQIQLVLVKGPGIVPTWYTAWDDELNEYAEKHQLTYINMIDKKEEIGIDYSLDTFSEGRHMNVTGAEKVSDYMGKLLLEKYGVPNRHGEASLEKYWEKELIRYKKAKKG